jgi:hypothetical protein
MGCEFLESDDRLVRRLVRKATEHVSIETVLCDWTFAPSGCIVVITVIGFDGPSQYRGFRESTRVIPDTMAIKSHSNHYQTLSNLGVNYLVPKRITRPERAVIERMEGDDQGGRGRIGDG